MMRRLVLILLVTLTLAVVWLMAPWEAREERTASASPSIPLGLQGAAAALAEPGSTFPSDEAGLAAYLRISPLSVDKVLPAFDHWEHYGNWIKGYLSVKLYPAWHRYWDKSVEVRVYVDSQGWVVAYLEKSKAPANIMMWTGVTQGASNLQSISTTALEEALKRVLLAAEVDFTSLQPQVRYYHFQYPAATSIGIWAKVGTVAQGQDVGLKLSMVNGATIYSESVFPLALYGGWSSEYYSERERRWNVYSYNLFNPPTVPYAIELGDNKMTPGLDYSYSVRDSDSSENQTHGIAAVLIYNLP